MSYHGDRDEDGRVIRLVHVTSSPSRASRQEVGKDKNAERSSMNNIDIEARLHLIEILSDFREKLLIAGRLNEKVRRPVFRRVCRGGPARTLHSSKIPE